MTSRFDEKLAEARYFLNRMRVEISIPDPLPLTANLRACIGAARSVVLYAEEDAFEVANGRPAKLGEIGNKVPAIKQLRGIADGLRLLRFFQDLRNDDVHVKPSGSLSKVSHTLRAVAFSGGAESKPAFATVYTLALAEWPDPGPDVFSLCEQYLGEIEKFLVEAAAQGLIRR